MWPCARGSNGTISTCTAASSSTGARSCGCSRSICAPTGSPCSHRAAHRAIWCGPPARGAGRWGGAERRDVVLPAVHGVAVTIRLLAATAVIALGGEPGAVAGALSGVTPPPGRLETVGYRGGVSAMVDTAHNPAALRTALTA